MITWQPSASWENLQLRAKILARIRQFFAERDVLEVETPLLCSATASDPFIASIQTQSQHYLQTSPEFAMKRLLAAYPYAIYQLGKAFRAEEVGRQHNPEFTLLEWYRPGFNDQDLIQEIDELMQSILQTQSADRLSYAELFEKYLSINPHQCSIKNLEKCAQKFNLQIDDQIQADKDTWLHLLMTHVIEPQISNYSRPLFIYDYPASQAALARIQAGNPSVAKRFELYFKGMELANGFYELRDAVEQRQRFLADQKKRQALHLTKTPIDEYLLAALQQGLPDCAGVALGVDRLMMIAAGTNSIRDVISFDWERI